MIFTKHRNLIRWIIVVASFVIITLILWNTYVFFQNFKAEERSKMQNWSFAQSDLLNTSDLEVDIGELHLQIVKSNTTTPMITVDQDGNIGHKNIDEKKAKDTVYLQKLILKFSGENRPIEMRFNDEVLATLYYGNSPLLNKLKYYPLALLLIIFLFGTVAYLFYRSTKNVL